LDYLFNDGNEKTASMGGLLHGCLTALDMKKASAGLAWFI
jgi:hypothetical protein